MQVVNTSYMMDKSINLNPVGNTESFGSSTKFYCIVLYLFVIYHENVINIYKLAKSRIDKNNNVCDEKYITTNTNLVYH